MDERDDWSVRSRSHKRDKISRNRGRRRYSRRRLGGPDGKDDVSCCGRPRRRYHRYRRYHHHHKRDKSRHRSKKSDRKEVKDDASSPLPPPLRPPPASAANEKQKQEEGKKSREKDTSTGSVAGKVPTSAEISAQDKASSSPGLPSREAQKLESRENAYRSPSVNKSEVLQELCVTQCIRDGFEMSRLAYTTCFPVDRKPNFIYLPQLRFVANNKPDYGQRRSTQLSAPDSSREPFLLADSYRNRKADYSKGKTFAMGNKISRFVRNLNGCCLALRKARKNISNLKLLAAGRTLSEVRGYDTDTKAIINDLKYLRQLIDKKFEN